MTYFIYFVFILAAFNNIYSQYKVDSMLYNKNYFPGTYDINGRYLGSTETMSIVVHKGKLFAGMGNWMDYPITSESEGTQVLRKDTYNSPWVVDTSLGPGSLRSEAILSVIFSKDYQGNILNPPVSLLVGGFSDIQPPRIVNIWVRNDTTGKWIANAAYVLPTGSAAIRCFKIHTDKVTLKQWLFCGVAEGNIIKAGFNPNSPGFLYIDTAKELRNLGRVMAMTVCNNDLYAAAGLDIIGTDTIGGLYRRIDGVNPIWQLVYRWPYIPSAHGDENNIMRGITTIPDPLASNNEVIIGTRSNPGIIQIIQPFNNHNVYTELNVKSFLGMVWGVNYTGPSLTAYNYFEPDTINNQKVWWVSLGAIHPNGNVHPYNGSYFLLRYQNGTYKYGHIYDNNYPVPNGQSLRATRTICKSPFQQDSNKVYYFGGYDCANDTSNNTSWIYKGRFVNTLSIIIKTNTIPGKYSLEQNYPNPFNPITKIKFGIPENIYTKITLYDLLGRELQTLLDGNIDAGSYEIVFDGSKYPSGIYYYTMKCSKYHSTKKMILIK